VCEAYLQRLNRTVSRVPPYCDRPESDVVTGFSRLKRLQLTAGEYNRLGFRVEQLYIFLRCSNLCYCVVCDVPFINKAG
jgi:hypothetical protein